MFSLFPKKWTRRFTIQRLASMIEKTKHLPTCIKKNLLISKLKNRIFSSIFYLAWHWPQTSRLTPLLSRLLLPDNFKTERKPKRNWGGSINVTRVTFDPLVQSWVQRPRRLFNSYKMHNFSSSKEEPQSVLRPFLFLVVLSSVET